MQENIAVPADGLKESEALDSSSTVISKIEAIFGAFEAFGTTNAPSQFTAGEYYETGRTVGGTATPTA